MLNIFKIAAWNWGSRTALAMHQQPPTGLVFPLWMILCFSVLKKGRVFSRRKLTHHANDKAINNIRTCVCTNQFTNVTFPETVFNNAQELSTRNSTRWHKSMDISFHTESQKYLGRLNLSLTEKCEESWQFLIVSWMPATQWALYIHGTRSLV